jgi:hypothetical protein
MNDVATLTDEDTGNFATINPLDMGTMATQSANLFVWNQAGASWQSARGTIGVSSGKWYWEAQADSNTYLRIGVALQTASLTSTYSNPTDSWTYVDTNGNKTGNGSETGYGASYANGDTIGIALDMDAGTLTFYKNGVSQGVAFNTGLSGKEVFPLFASYNINRGFIANFGQRPFKYTPPTGYKKLNTYNLPDSTIADGSQYFNAVTYTGDGGTSNSLSYDFSPDLVWSKSRSNAQSNILYDSIRGGDRYLISNSTNAEGTISPSAITFDSNGHTWTQPYSASNFSGYTYVNWVWRGSDSSPVSNTDGTITSTVSANTDSGFSVITFTGNGTAGATIGHGLGAKPAMIIVKNRTYGVNWRVYHESLGATKFLSLNLTNAVGTSSLEWNNTEPTSSIITVGTSDNINRNGDNIVMYAFAEVEGFSKFGSYIGNGSTDGPFVYTGFRPAFVVAKRTDLTSSWQMWDTSRSTYNATTHRLRADLSNAEDTGAVDIDTLSNGFKLRNLGINSSGGTYIYMAFAENPFKQSLAR